MSAPLEILYLLDRIVKTITESGVALSRTKISRLIGCHYNDLHAAFEHGCERKVLIWSEGDFYDIKKPFVIAEDAFYPAVETDLRKLWQEDKFHENEFLLKFVTKRVKNCWKMDSSRFDINITQEITVDDWQRI